MTHMEKRLEALKALTTADELKELQVKPLVHLKYIGKQCFPGVEPIRLWNVVCVGHPFHESTRSVEGLKELGILPKGGTF